MTEKQCTAVVAAALVVIGAVSAVVGFKIGPVEGYAVAAGLGYLLLFLVWVTKYAD